MTNADSVDHVDGEERDPAEQKHSYTHRQTHTITYRHVADDLRPRNLQL